MLKDSFFTVKETSEVEHGITWRIALNVLHPIFQAHFAGNPVLPGACIAQMIKEIAEDFHATTLYICAIKNMKFLHVINPLETPDITVQMILEKQDSGISVSAVISDKDIIFSKATLFLKPVIA